MLNLDTHIVVKLLDGDIDREEEVLIVENDLAISSMVLWELAKLVQLGRIEMDLRGRSFARFLSRARVIPVDLDIAITSTNLDFRGDPADEIIAATSVVTKYPLLTRDQRIKSSKIVPLATAM